MCCNWTSLHHWGLRCTWTYLGDRSLCCSWTCLHYRDLEVSTIQRPELHLEVSVLQRPVLHLQVSALQRHLLHPDVSTQWPELHMDMSTQWTWAPPELVYTKEACTPPERVKTTDDWAAPEVSTLLDCLCVCVFTLHGPLLHLFVSTLQRLRSSWTCLQQRGLSCVYTKRFWDTYQIK